MLILQIHRPQELKKILHDIKVDPYGIRIMYPKTLSYLIRINSFSCICANILKQEMLSLGADAAVARTTLTGRIKKTDCLLMGSLAQYSRLAEKLKMQPFGLDDLGRELSGALANYQKDEFILNLGKHKLPLALGNARIMGIVNLTPDSFSGDGFYQGTGDRRLVTKIIDYVHKMVADGADIIDIGAESSRPGAKPISVKEELSRIIPVIKALAKKIKVPISIDTYKPEVARQALDNGALIINDITGLRNSKMAKIVAKYKAAVIIMHMKGSPQSMQNNPVYKSLIEEIVSYLSQAAEKALSFGISKDKIIVDPGIGFGKTLQHNLQILKRLKELKVLGLPILVGPSRKSFIGKMLDVEPGKRIFGSVSACVFCANNGAHIVRVHDVKAVYEALKVNNAIVSS